MTAGLVRRSGGVVELPVTIAAAPPVLQVRPLVVDARPLAPFGPNTPVGTTAAAAELFGGLASLLLGPLLILGPPLFVLFVVLATS